MRFSFLVLFFVRASSCLHIEHNISASSYNENDEEVYIFGNPKTLTKILADDEQWCQNNPTIRVLPTHQYIIESSLQEKDLETIAFKCTFFCVAPPKSRLRVEMHFFSNIMTWPHPCSFKAWDNDEAFYSQEEATPLVTLPYKAKHLPKHFSLIGESGIRISFLTKSRSLHVEINRCQVDKPSEGFLNFSIALTSSEGDDDGEATSKGSDSKSPPEVTWQRLWVAFVEIPLMILGCVIYYSVIKCCYNIHAARQRDRASQPNSDPTAVENKHYHFGTCYCPHCPAAVARRTQRNVALLALARETEPSINESSQSGSLDSGRTRSPSSPSVESLNVAERPPPYETVVRAQRSMSSSAI